MFKSALSSVLGERSELGFKPRNKVLVIFIDGLGYQNLKAAAGHAPFLAGAASKGQVLHAAFPSTTSVNISSFATGLRPGGHGIIGHVVRDRYFQRTLNLLNGWTEETDPLQWQPNQTISEAALEKGVVTNVISATEYRTTGFTKATMRGVLFHEADEIADRFEMAKRLLESQERSINYLYIQELDQLGHVKGWESDSWRALLEQLNGILERFTQVIPKDAGIVITADHGMVDTNDQKRVELDELLRPRGVEFVGGDTRSMYLYLKPEVDKESLLQELETYQQFSAYDANALVEAGLYGELGPQAKERLPDLVLLAKGNNTLYHSDFSKPRSYRMIAHHGGLSSQELQIPLIRFNI
ncbi:nucleotide pyrophosphatase/phosphodiesterase family protein [Aquiluna sp. KACHI24]|uniref:alkaline phosphatase family protein n=1 Tax=Aquiluna sp. KACHI24 TaxID=2968831 RepID=UPI00220590BB|nr:nucleotide pyrophosphatase/phosphodiesterase family protein [Aquiluna sp. KACHI24]BDQ00350.1 alkaline phosphatase family protein [Aquiluna sp. KACHI24]